MPLDQICPEGFPARHAVLHDRRPEHVKHYEDTMKMQVDKWNQGDDTPKVVTRKNCKFAVWSKIKHHVSESSVWDDSGGGTVKGPGWVEPILPEKDAITVEGDWVAFTSWIIGNFGHFGTYSRTFHTSRHHSHSTKL